MLNQWILSIKNNIDVKNVELDIVNIVLKNVNIITKDGYNQCNLLILIVELNYDSYNAFK